MSENVNDAAQIGSMSWFEETLSDRAVHAALAAIDRERERQMSQSQNVRISTPARLENEILRRYGASPFDRRDSKYEIIDYMVSMPIDYATAVSSPTAFCPTERRKKILFHNCSVHLLDQTLKKKYVFRGPACIEDIATNGMTSTERDGYPESFVFKDCTYVLMTKTHDYSFGISRLAKITVTYQRV